MRSMAICCQASETSEWKGSVRMEAVGSRALRFDGKKEAEGKNGPLFGRGHWL